MSRGTRTRRATHATALAGGLRCPGCDSSHVLSTLSRNGRRAGSHWCGACGMFFTPKRTTRELAA